jgi:hypothetical protein
MRKTAPLVAMIERTNQALTRPTPESWTKEQGLGFRFGVITALEAALHEAGAYAGYSYTELAKVKRGADGQAVEPWSCEDDSRRNYYIHPNLID